MSIMSRRLNRRQFLGRSAVAGVGFWVAGGVGHAKDREKLNIACVGVGGKGSSDTDQAGRFGNIVAVCDIDDRNLDAMAERFPKAKKYHDFRKMLAEMGDRIDAVTVSTPDHTHAPAAIMAMKMKKHVYVQKPLTHSVKEARLMREVAREYGVCTQMGNQGSASDGLREGIEVIQAGAIGPVHEAHIWTDRPIWPQAPKIMTRPRPSEPPAYVHWDLWLGPATERPYSGERQYNDIPPYHPFNWRGWWDFGTGALGDMACHTTNLPYRALKLAYPSSVVAECGDLNPETYPSWATVTYQFPARGELPPVKFVWYEGHRNGKKNLPPRDLFHGEKPTNSGSLMVGDKGVLYSPGDNGTHYVLLPRKDFEGFKKPPRRLPRNGGDDEGMKAEWVDAILANKPETAFSNFDIAALLTETVLLGNVAIRAQGKKLEWDGPGLRFTNAPEANGHLHTEYRKGWTL
jgi:predicted dehydrogenase